MMLFQAVALAYAILWNLGQIQCGRLMHGTSNSSVHGTQSISPPDNATLTEHTETGPIDEHTGPTDEHITKTRPTDDHTVTNVPAEDHATSQRHIVVEHGDLTAYIVESQYAEQPVSGKWSMWDDTDCLATCGIGYRLRLRTCTEPPPAYGGAQCEGPATKTEACVKDSCPVTNGKWSRWEDTDCLSTCGNGYRHRLRTCTEPPPSPGGAQCDGPAMKTEACVKDSCPDINGKWSRWEDTDCLSTVTSGIGFRVRIRTCTDPPPSPGGTQCEGPSVKTEACVKDMCPVDGAWAAWADSGICSVTCGIGSQTRTRHCTNPPPTNGGAKCNGSLPNIVSCNETVCPALPETITREALQSY